MSKSLSMSPVLARFKAAAAKEAEFAKANPKLMAAKKKARRAEVKAAAAKQAKKEAPVRNKGLSVAPAGTNLYHGSGARLRPGTSLRPSNAHAERVGQGKKKGLKGVYFTNEKAVANVQTSAGSGDKVIRYNLRKPKANGKHGNSWETPGIPDPRIGGPRNPKREVMTKQRIKPTSVTPIRITPAKINPAKASLRDGLTKYKGPGVEEGHSYANRARTSLGKKSHIAFDNMPKHTSAQGQSRLPGGVSKHSTRTPRRVV